MLVIDDDDGIREVARMSLELVGGFQVHTAANGHHGLELASTIRPDGILLDVMMPGMDGPAVLRALRDDTALHAVPVVFLTAKVQAAERAHLTTLDAAGVLAKPFDPMTLPTELAALFDWTP